MAVFISYSHQDAAIVETLSLRLLTHNIKVWRDVWKTSAGDAFANDIQEAIATSTCFCVFLSAHSLGSDWVAREISAALNRASEDPSFLIIPIVLDGTEPPASLRDRLRVDLRGDSTTALDQIVRAILSVENRPPKGSVVLEGTYYLHFGIEDKLGPTAYVMEVDVVSFDTEETFSVLSQFEFTGDGDATLRDFGVEDTRALRELLLTTAADSFAASPAIIRLKSAEAKRGRFTLQNSAGTAVVNVRFRITIVGEGPRGVLVFNAGALFSQICTTCGYGDSGQRTTPGTKNAIQTVEPAVKVG